MQRIPFNQWIKQRRTQLNLTQQECVERVNVVFKIDLSRTTWKEWELRETMDAPRDRARKIAVGLGVPEAEVFAAAGLLPDEQNAPAMPSGVATMYARLSIERRGVADAVIRALFHEEQDEK